jgi:acyl carrier protein
MGLEGVELVIAMENAFEISITDEEAENIYTPKDAIDLILNKVKMGDDQICLSQIAFHRYRQILVNDFGVIRKAVKRDTDLSKLVPVDHHKKFWKQVQKESKIQNFPKLSRPKWMVYMSWIIFVFTVFLIGYEFDFLIGIIIGVVLFWGIMFVTESFQTMIPDYYQSMDKLVLYTVSTNPRVFKKENYWSYNQIRQQVKDIVKEVLGTDKYEEGWEFVEDFGIV